MRVEYKIFLASFSIALVVFFVLHLVWLPFYWAHAPSQLVRPVNLYSPGTWTPGVIFYSGLAAFSVLIVSELYLWFKRGQASEVVIFAATFCLAGMGLWLFLAFVSLRWGNPSDWLWYVLSGISYASDSDFVMIIGTLLFSSVGAVLSTATYDLYKLARYVKKRLSKTE